MVRAIAARALRSASGRLLRSASGRLLRSASGIAVAAGLVARHAGPAFAPVTLAERLDALPRVGLPLLRPVRIGWNDRMVPFIEAEGTRDLAVGLGVVHAHLRRGQLEALRRIASGRVAEMAGPAAIGIDRSIRMLGIAQVVPRLAAGLSETARDWLGGFLDGMNAAVAAGPRPPELEILGIGDEPWTVEDFLTLSRLLSADLAWPIQRRLLGLRDRTAPAAWAALWPKLLGGEATGGQPSGAIEAALAAATVRAGSNAAAVDARRSATKSAMLAGDPHLTLSLPNPWLAAWVSGGGIEAVGLMLPGVPFVAMGRNRAIAWGGTSLHAASTDLVDVSGLGPGDFTWREEVLRVRGGRRVRVRMRACAQGPVVSDGMLFPSRRETVALRWAGHEASGELDAMLGVMRAQDRTGFQDSLRGFGIPGLMMVYAGPDGIGRQAAVRLPCRAAGLPADLVVSPERAARDWGRFSGGDALFSEWDPEAGFVASANERLEGAGPARVPLGWFFAPESRVRRMRALLEGAERMTPEAMMGLARDAVQPNALAVRDWLAAHAPSPVGRGRTRLLASLAAWDGGYEASSEGALAFELLLGAVVRAAPDQAELRALESVWVGRWMVLERLLALDRVAAAGLVRRALPLAARRFVRLGHWGAAHVHVQRHALAGVPGFSRRFEKAVFEGAGGNETLDKTGHGFVTGRHRIRFGAGARYMFDLSDPDRNEVVLFGGQDGWPGSACFADQFGLWRRGAAMRLPLTRAAAAREFGRVSVLAAAP